MRIKKSYSIIKNYLKLTLLRYLLPNNYYLRINGFCPCCEKDVIFESYNPWLRDHLVCLNCYCKPRERALVLMLEKHYPNWKDLKIHETSPMNRGGSIKFKRDCKYYTPTHYFPDKTLGSIINGFRNEDLEQQTFEDESFDLVISQDVMEHIYNPEKAFSEIARTLKPGGAHIFTVPIINKHRPTQVWAIKDESNNPQFLFEPEYHGNPINPFGSPVTMHWGFDIVDTIKKVSNLHTTIEYLNDLKFGVQAEFIEVLVSKKNP